MSKITYANLDWQIDKNGLTVPVSADFGDVYFCKENGLNESRYVFIEQNNLQQRLENLDDYQTFVIGEVGFGTGLNVLAVWQLWQKIVQQNPNTNSRLHIITTEKFPLKRQDLQQALSIWQELTPFSEQLLANYPPPLAGCHRLNFWQDRLTLDLWLGDACDSLSQLIGQQKVDAWFLDGFAPACNSELWAENLFNQIKQLSKPTTTLATFSVASLVKNNLKNQGFNLKKVKGFGKKREMLTAFFTENDTQNLAISQQNSAKFNQLKFRYNKKIPLFGQKFPFYKRQKLAKKLKKFQKIPLFICRIFIQMISKNH
ncbi:tRNA (5-methylaminomethyl-2-thiouridine)(34)-methyltransferase MnmD [Moraxella boevrei]|uniref:tRNA (5-methylaminomethyl-2-thiouridine)(34)-methyltransferase MnmD n=1 Tax=Faucicola boevrei TaxID=346665 RepID=UPI003736482D